MSATSHRIEIGEDPKFQKLSWKWQRMGFIALLVFVFAGMLGVFGGGGVLSPTDARSGGLEVSYDRFIRFATTTEFVATTAERTTGGAFTLQLDRAFVDAVRLQHILPPPETVHFHSDSCVYTFSARSNPARLSVRFSYAPRHAGILRSTLRAGESEVAFTQYVSP